MNTDLERAIKAARAAAAASKGKVSPEQPSKPVEPNHPRSTPPPPVEHEQTQPQRTNTESNHHANGAGIRTGRYQIHGTVYSMREQDTPYGRVTKILVELPEAQGRVWGNAPKDLLSRNLIKVGSPIQFYAAVVPSQSDSKFGLFQRASSIQ